MKNYVNTRQLLAHQPFPLLTADSFWKSFQSTCEDYPRRDVILVTATLVLDQVSQNGEEPSWRNMLRPFDCPPRFEEIARRLLAGTAHLASTAWGSPFWYAGSGPSYKESTDELKIVLSAAVSAHTHTSLHVHENKKYWKSGFTDAKTIFWLLKEHKKLQSLVQAPDSEIRDLFENLAEILSNLKYSEMVAERDANKVLMGACYYVVRHAERNFHYSIVIPNMVDWIKANVKAKPKPAPKKQPQPRGGGGGDGYGSGGYGNRGGYGNGGGAGGQGNGSGNRGYGSKDAYKYSWRGNADGTEGQERWAHRQQGGGDQESHYLTIVKKFEDKHKVNLKNITRNKDGCCVYHCLHTVDPTDFSVCTRKCTKQGNARFHDNEHNKNFIRALRQAVAGNPPAPGPE